MCHTPLSWNIYLLQNWVLSLDFHSVDVPRGIDVAIGEAFPKQGFPKMLYFICLLDTFFCDICVCKTFDL